MVRFMNDLNHNITHIIEFIIGGDGAYGHECNTT
jgi:hypothetical protein